MLPAQETVAGSLGYISIACWLCAQLPQVVKNIRLHSCEGLSLPFLVNWLFGDVTNLIGCLLTDQLPFQTYLATYYCIVDFTLCIQYLYYNRSTHKPHHHHQHQHHVHYASVPTTAITSPIQGRASQLGSPADSPHLPSRHLEGTLSALTAVSSSSSATVQPPRNKRKHSTGPGYGHGQGQGHGHGYRSHSTSQLFGADLGMTSPLPPNATDSYLDLYAAALDVARAAERVSSRRSESRRRRLSRQTTSNTMSNLDEDHVGGMMESFHSEMSGSSSLVDLNEEVEEDGKKKQMSQSTGNLLDGRGRSRNMRNNNPSPIPTIQALRGEGEDLDVLEGLPEEGERDRERPGIHRSKSRSLSVVRTQSGRGKGRRAAGVAFMSLGLLLRFGPSPMSTGVGHGEGRVIERQSGVTLPSSLSAKTSVPVPIRHPQPFLYLHFLPGTDSPSTTIVTNIDAEFKTHDHDHSDPPPEPPSFKRLVGRTSAWACTTLYLTSRLPQIWKNFMRKSVEGLSIFLFFFAFCGNLTYVASILLNPVGSASPSDAGHYLLEALPYLLGSGGTLLFDMTIMIQSFLYGSSPPIDEIPTISTRRKRRKRQTTEDGLSYSGMNGQQAQVQQGWKSERTPLLQSRERDRSLSPEIVKRPNVNEGR